MRILLFVRNNFQIVKIKNIWIFILKTASYKEYSGDLILKHLWD